MEWIACESYRAIGHEDIRVPRILVMICWILGAIPLHALARRASSGVCAIVAAALYLFMPYAIVATRSFQPDAPMTLCTLIAVLAVARYFESPVTSRFVTAVLLVGLATVVKPMSVFLTLPALIGLALGAPAVAGARRQSSIRAARAARVPARDAVLRVRRGLRHACPRSDAHALRAGAPHLELLLARLADADPARVRAAALRAVDPGRTHRAAPGRARPHRRAVDRLRGVRRGLHVPHADARLLPPALRRDRRARCGGDARTASSLGGDPRTQALSSSRAPAP